ncbi:hypothetical protein GCK72_008955 [Caenorhabditis remanei]|uniref:DUF38 domain-containing protein n=1 Tax=Caenorhabditis remanei TaxID=31234 RepID=A0A6A5H1N2_CAERE|nr:hypothetical protein GCK72_008955 [Caenorhabditis remanei]KAF1760706.1 hypothetical protein GCK72_008955 [Caenorhabditis remanei]
MSKPSDLEDAFEQLSIDTQANKRDSLAFREGPKRHRALVDKTIKFSCRRDHILIEIRNQGRSRKVLYAGVDWNSEVVFSNVDSLSKYKPDKKVEISVKRQCKLIKSEDYEILAFNELAVALKNPKQELEAFIFEYCADYANMPREIQDVESSKSYYEKMGALLVSLDHKLSARRLKLIVEDPDDVTSILPQLVPDYLQIITINSEVSSNSWQNHEKIKRIVNLEQWMKAKMLLCTQNIFAFFPMENLMNFKHLRIKECSVDTEFLLKLRELFSKSPNLGKCYIESRYKFDAEVLAEHVGEPAPSTQWSSNVRRYQFPDSEKFLEFQFHGDTISIQRYPKNNTTKI